MHKTGLLSAAALVIPFSAFAPALGFSVIAFAAAPALAQATPAQAAASHAAQMTNADVISLTAAGIAPDIIVSRIRSAPSTAFDTSVDALKLLKAAGVANDVIVCMVTGGAPPASPPGDSSSTTNGMSDFKEPVFKEGLWEERHSRTVHPGDAPFTISYSSCHSHASDHGNFEKLRTGSVGGNAAHCTYVGATVLEGRPSIELRCNVDSIVLTMKTGWVAVDEDHITFTNTVDYSPPSHGLSTVTTIGNMTFKGSCPAGLQPGQNTLSRPDLGRARPKH